MIYTIDRIVEDVRVCMDQNRTSDALLADADIDTLKLDEVIKSKILEAVERVHRVAPYQLLESGYNIRGGVYWENEHVGWVLLPLDFMRLVVFEMSDWEIAVTTPITTDDPLYKKQRSRIAGIRGTTQRPVCALAMRPEGKTLEFYSCKSNDATIRKAVYLPYPKIDLHGGIDICERCYNDVVYTISGLTLTSFGETENANTFFARANESLGL